MHTAAYVEPHPEDFRQAGLVTRATQSALASTAEAMMSWEQGVHDEVRERLGAAAGSAPFAETPSAGDPPI
jgi:hypothetical protein